MISFEADLPVGMWVRRQYPALATVLVATFGLANEKALVQLLSSATTTARFKGLKGALERVLAPQGLALDIRCTTGDAPSQEVTCMVFSVYKPETQGKVKPALTIGVDENGVYIDLQGLFVHPGSDTRCRIDLEAIAAQLARTPKAQPFITAALKALPVKPQTRAQTFKAAALEALEAAAKVAPRLAAEGRTMLEVRYTAIVNLLQAVFDIPNLVPMVVPIIDNVLQRGADVETLVLGTDRMFKLMASDPQLPTGQIRLEITSPHGQVMGLVITPRGCGIDFGYLRLSTEHGNHWDVEAFVHQMSKTPDFARRMPRMLEVFSRLVRETPEMRGLRLDVMRHLLAPAKAVNCA